MAKRKRGQSLEKKRSREITDSLPVMISTVYDPARETVRCAWRNERFVLGGFSVSSRAGSAMARPTSRPCSIGALRRQKVEAHLLHRRRDFEVTKLHKSALKIMKSLRRVTLCA
jgi:hypothetical protein